MYLFNDSKSNTMNKRRFLKSIAIAAAGAGLPSHSWASLFKQAQSAAPGELASTEEFWAGIRKLYRLKPDYINLENGYYNIQPQPILDAFLDHVREVNYQGAYYMRTVQFDNKKRVAAKLAALAGCSPEELVITRNTTESLDMIISGYHWQPGDEAVMAEQDYGAMLDMFKQTARRFGMVNRIVSVPNHPASDDEIVQLYANAITPRTKLLMVSHMINITGHILPVQKICDMAHSKGVEVMVDGAHAFAQFQYKIPDLHCDYYGASLHKWLSTPLGAGMLYVKKGSASHVWPIFAEEGRSENDIARLNHTGTHAVHTDLAIENAITFYEMLGAERKESRMRYLQQYWTSKLRHTPGVVINTPEDPVRSCGIANAGVTTMKPGILAERLLKDYKIYTVAIDGANVHGCRITPNVFTTTQELDVLVKALTELGAEKS